MPFNKITVSGSVDDNRYVYKAYKRAYSTAVKLRYMKKIFYGESRLFIIIIIPV